MKRHLPRTDAGRSFLAGVVFLMIGLSIALPPVALWGPGVALTVSGALFIALAFTTPPTPPEADS